MKLAFGFTARDYDALRANVNRNGFVADGRHRVRKDRFQENV